MLARGSLESHLLARRSRVAAEPRERLQSVLRSAAWFCINGGCTWPDSAGRWRNTLHHAASQPQSTLCGGNGEASLARYEDRRLQLRSIPNYLSLRDTATLAVPRSSASISWSICTDSVRWAWK